MKFFAVATLFTASAVLGQYVPCREPLFRVALCCDNDVLGIAGLNCIQPPTTPTSKGNFNTLCNNAAGRNAKCCVASLLNSAVLCIGSSP